MNNHKTSTPSTYVVVFLGILGGAQGLDLEDFYPFGKESGDVKLRTGAERIHAWVNLSTAVFFYGEEHRGLYVNLDGVISFDQPVSLLSKYVASKSKHFPIHRKMVAPFFANINTTTNGGVFFRGTEERMLLIRATNDVRRSFAYEKGFQATSLFIATWVKVEYQSKPKDKIKSFQLVLVSDGKKTFAIFQYEGRSTKRNVGGKELMVWLGKPLPKAGFSFGDEFREFHLPGSGTNKVHLLSKNSNVNRPGKWIYLIGSSQTAGQTIKSAESLVLPNKQGNNEQSTGKKGCYLVNHSKSSYNALVRRPMKTAHGCNLACGVTGFTIALFHHIDGCMCAEEEILRGSYRRLDLDGKCRGKSLFTVYRTGDVMMGDEARQEDSADTGKCGDAEKSCSENAVCKRSTHHCCECKDSYYGNGMACLLDGEGVNLVGDLVGKINDVTIQDVLFSVYSDFPSRTTYISLDPVLYPIGWPLRVMMPIGTSLGFLFARPGVGSPNGFSIMGDSLVRRAKVTFETGEICHIRETFLGEDENGLQSFKTEITGNVPTLDENVTIVFDDYVHSYRYDRLGVISGFYTSSFRVGKRKYKVKVIEALEFDEQKGCLNIGDSKMVVSQMRSSFELENSILRFSLTTELSDREVKLCGPEKQRCSRDAKCVVKNSQEYCECNFGFGGNGVLCEDVDECALEIDDCSTDADCSNSVGSYTCTCRQGYSGDGKNCIPTDEEGLCGPEKRKCDSFAQCVFSERGVENCECNPGFMGDGVSCRDIDECSLDIHACATTADCQNTAGSYTCTCRSGYVGDGKTCGIITEGSGNGCTPDGGQCDTNAECDQGSCRCLDGFLSNGSACQDANECELGIHTCDKNAFCANSIGSFKCTCNDGYSGDGFKCVFQGTLPLEGCNGAKCHDDAECDESGKIAECKCRKGYKGNGLSCRDINECNENEDLDCDGNAFCRNTPGSYECRCRPGYRGDGLKCTYVDPCKNFQCGSNSKCVLREGSPVCQCYTGYYGNGNNCKDYNECEAYRDTCDKNARCVNTAGSYKCVCKPGYLGDGFSCKSDGSCSGSRCHVNAECVEINGTRSCRCNSGFVGSGLVCADLNECENNSFECPQFSRCINTFGSYTCRCNSGYQWNGVECQEVCLRCLNGGTCTETGCLCREGYSGERCEWVGDEFLMFTQGSTIQRLSLPPRQDTVGVLHEVSRGLIVALDYDHKNKLVYFTDVAGKSIWRIRYNGTGAEKIITSGLSSPEGIAVDYVAGNLYWTDSMFDRIEVAKLDGSNRKVLFKTRLINPRSIVVHPGRGTLYWADWNRASPKIEVAHMDGGSRHMFAQQTMGLPNGLSVDRRNDELCWTDAKFGSISCANLDEGKPLVVYSSARYPFGLTSFGQYLLWTDWSARTIQQYNRETFKLMTPIKSSMGSHGSFYDIKAVQKPQESGFHQCAEDNGGCTNLCLARPGGRSCACPNSFHLVNRADISNGSGSLSGEGSGSGAGSGLQSIFGQPTNTIQVRLSETVCVNETEFKILRSEP